MISMLPPEGHAIGKPEDDIEPDMQLLIQRHQETAVRRQTGVSVVRRCAEGMGE